MSKEPPVLTRDDFSIDGKRIRVSVAKQLHAAGWRYCRRHNDGKGALLPVEAFADHRQHSRRKAPYCKACWNEHCKQDKARAKASNTKPSEEQ